jgi:hypothetical protein
MYRIYEGGCFFLIECIFFKNRKSGENIDIRELPREPPFKRAGQDSGSVLVGSVNILIQINSKNRRQNRLQNRPKPATLTAPNNSTGLTPFRKAVRISTISE